MTGNTSWRKKLNTQKKKDLNFLHPSTEIYIEEERNLSPCRVIDAKIDIPGTKSSYGGNRLHLKIYILDKTSRIVVSENVKYVSSLLSLLENDDRFDGQEIPAVLQMLATRLEQPIDSSVDIEEEISLSRLFLADAKKELHRLHNCVAIRYSIVFANDNTPYIQAYCRDSSNQFSPVRFIDLSSLVNELRRRGFSNRQVECALKVLIYDFEHSLDMRLKSYSEISKQLKAKFAEEAKDYIIILNGV